uniref:phenylalanine--tRNA ligase n=1 Tax=Nitophyllum punctatum TaxID=158729 RepID=A0A4D6WY69_9FLOR|nr:Phenylalanine-tRNA ligase beta subunit [Nitophyllum punctatum]
MKFSWKILNQFINLKEIEFNKFVDILTLSGFEVEQIKKEKEIKEIFIQLSITANRKEVNCLFNLAQEIKIIFNKPLTIQLYKFETYLYDYTNYVIKQSQQLKYIKFNTINNIAKNNSPDWLKQYLRSCDNISTCLIEDIQNYARIKWGHKIYIVDLLKFNTNLIEYRSISIKKGLQSSNQEILMYKNYELLKLDNNLNLNQELLKFKYQNILLCWPIYNNAINRNQINRIDTFNNAYNEILQILTTNSNCTISQSYSNSHKILDKQQNINVKLSDIQSILGPVNNNSPANKYLSYKNIIYHLRKLQLKPVYKLYNKDIYVQVPREREHDLQRSIDIIEEVGRIHGFNHFLNHLPTYQQKGKIKFKMFYKNKIHDTLRYMGFNEVLNSPLVDSGNRYSLFIDNPITQEHKVLRTNILENLIHNYQTNYKQRNHRIEIFEIGQIFYSGNRSDYNENTHLAGLIYNKHYWRKNWTDKPENFSWLHAKGLLEIFLNQINSQITWKHIFDIKLESHIKNLYFLFEQNKCIAIYNQQKQKTIGIFGQINRKYIHKLYDNHNTYIFEINIDELIKTININKHLKYRIKPYSLYPSISRDISIEISKSDEVNKIKLLLSQIHNNLIESIDILNEYSNTKSINKRSICLRITYRAINKTLTHQDINSINENIVNLLQKQKKEILT